MSPVKNGGVVSIKHGPSVWKDIVLNII
jgi:hypothetical protein